MGLEDEIGRLERLWRRPEPDPAEIERRARGLIKHGKVETEEEAYRIARNVAASGLTPATRILAFARMQEEERKRGDSDR